MKRDYQVGVKDDVEFFTGIEIERSPAFGLMTLFVVGVHPSEDIIKMAEEKNCEAIYFGANQSFPNPTAITLDSINIWKEWETMIKNVLTSTKIYCTLDIDIKCLTCTSCAHSLGKPSKLFSLKLELNLDNSSLTEEFKEIPLSLKNSIEKALPILLLNDAISNNESNLTGLLSDKSPKLTDCNWSTPLETVKLSPIIE